ncbi:MAG: hypothetical protein DBX58_03430 [Clostridiales bacterium]|nr:MAG: hypothetical protein DBX58_03430 [Clostridiales bacterium]
MIRINENATEFLRENGEELLEREAISQLLLGNAREARGLLCGEERFSSSRICEEFSQKGFRSPPCSWIRPIPFPIGSTGT